MAEAVRPARKQKVKSTNKKVKEKDPTLEKESIISTVECKSFNPEIDNETNNSCNSDQIIKESIPKSINNRDKPSMQDNLNDNNHCNPSSIDNISKEICDKSNILPENKILFNAHEQSKLFSPLSEVQNKLKELKVCDNDIKNINPLCNTPSAPQLKEMGAREGLSPNILKPNYMLVRQRCTDIQSEINLETSETDSRVEKETIIIKPYTEVQLLALYNNVQLEEKDNVISVFLENEKRITQSKFYEIVLNYLRARTNLSGTEKEIKSHLESYKIQKESIWVFEERVITEEGTCEDDQLLYAKCSHEIATYQHNIAKHISKLLKQIREKIFESYTLHLYTSEISKLQVENYLQSVITSCSKFTSLPKNCEIQCQFMRHSESVLTHVKNLKECISVLMSFCRRNVRDSKFTRDIKTWLSETIAILLRVATHEDHLFIINLLMRCPLGVGDWGSLFIQVVPPAVEVNQDLFGSPFLDHLLTVLSIILEPAKERTNFLHHFKGSINCNNETEQSGDSSWIVVDSSGEDEEDVTEMWHYFSENDIIQFINQIPFEKMFAHILLIEYDGKEMKYDVQKTSDHSIMKLFAFCTQLLKIFQVGLVTYQQARFKGVVKRLSRLIRHTVHYVTDHFKGFLEHSSKEKNINSVEDNAMAARLQVEYDEFFENAVKTVFLSPRCGAWQFLAVIPYTSISSLRLWRIAYKMHIGFDDDGSNIDNNEEVDWSLLLQCDDTRGRIQDRLGILEDSESYYLLTALANMAIMRPAREKEFVECIVRNLFEATMIHEDLRNSLNRTGRDLFLSITDAHPFTVSTLLTEMQEKLSLVGSLALYLFKFLNLDRWHPLEEDLQCLGYWLLFTPPSSLESQLTRIILAKLNWGFEGNELALPKSVHERVALVVVEAAIKIHSKAGQGNLLSEGVKHVTSVVYAPSPEQVLSKWCWAMLSQLHVHQMDQPDVYVREMLQNNQSLILRGVGDPSTSPVLEPLKKGLSLKHPLTIYAALLMSSWGHSVPEICNHVPESLELMVSNGQSEASLIVLSLVSPLFFNHHEELVSDAKFINALNCIISSDQTYVNLAKSYISSDAGGKIVKLFQGLILNQLLNFARFGLDDPSPIVKFWTDFLVLIPNWRTNLSVLKLIDAICQASLFDPPSLQILKEIFVEQQKILSGEKLVKGGLGSLLNWVSSGSGGNNWQISLLERSVASRVPWFALIVLTCDAQREVRSGLWKGLLKRLYNNPTLNLDVVFKEVCNELQLEDFSCNNLAVYRVAQQLLDLTCSHPAFPATAQIFLTLQLSRTPPQTGQYDCSSVIYKFYESFVNSNFLKKIKHLFCDAFTYWESQLAKERNREKEEGSAFTNQRRINYLTNLVSIHNAMSTWLEETRLYEAGLYIPALPPQVHPKKLMLIFQENWDIWPELVDLDMMKSEIESRVKSWHDYRLLTHAGFGSLSRSSTSSSPVHLQQQLSDAKESSTQEPLSPAESILKRIKEYDVPKGPPPLPAIIHKPSRKRGKTLNRESVLFDIERFTSQVVSHSQTMYLKSKEMCALDCVYAELLPQLWTNPVTKTVLTAKCKPQRNSKRTECSGAAKIVVEYSEKRLSEGIKAKVDQNREQYSSLYSFATQTPPLQLCEAAQQLEDLVKNVVAWHKNSQEFGGEESGSSSLISYGRELFYHIVTLTSEETSAYPPAKQLITTCADTLGKEFLYGHEDCQETLIKQVLKMSPQFGVLLSPHFTPMVTPVKTYIKSYASLSPNVSIKPDLCFMLLSKFEMDAWLREKATSAEDRSEVIKCVCCSLSSVIASANKDAVMCLELYRVHLRALLSFRFPEHFKEVLLLLLEMSVVFSDCGDVRRNVWYDFLNILAGGTVKFSPDMKLPQIVAAVKAFAQTQSVLPPSMVKGTLVLLSSQFVRQRLEFGLYGLYSKYKTDVSPLIALLGMVSFAHIFTASSVAQKQGLELTSQEIWSDLEGLWTAWVAPLGGKARASCPKWILELTIDKNVLLPWTPGDVTNPSQAVGMYAATLAFFHEVFVGSRILSRFLEYYHQIFATSAVKEHVLNVIHSHLCPLPWHHLEPTLKDLEIFSKILDEYLPECHSFIGNIFIQIPWDRIVRDFTNVQEGKVSSPNSPSEGVHANARSSVARLHILLLNVLVRISMEPSVRQSGLMHPLLVNATSFHWHHVDAKSFESVMNWFVMSFDPRIVLCMDNRNPIDLALLHLLHVAAGYAPDSGSMPHPYGPYKRRLLVRGVCRLLVTAATRHKALLNARKGLFGDTFSRLLMHMENQVVEVLPEEVKYEEGFYLSSEAINLIGGGASPPALQEVCRDSLLEWLRGSHPSRDFLMPLAAAISKGVLHLDHRSPLIQESIAAILNYIDTAGEGQVLSWFDLVSILSFPITNPSPMLSFAAQENHLLVIYIHTKWRLHIRTLNSHEHLFILANLTDLLTAVNPDEHSENWLLLVVGEVVDLIVQEVKRGEDYSNVWRQADALTDLLTCWGEDRSSAGLLAAIGFGKRSPLSPRVRLICKCMATFFKTQLVSPGYFCSLNEHKKATAGEDESDTSYNDSLKSLHRLLSLRSNNTYASHLPGLNYALEFIQQSQNTIIEAGALFDGLLSNLFPKEFSILQLRRDVDAIRWNPEGEGDERKNIVEINRENKGGAALPSAPPSQEL